MDRINSIRKLPLAGIAAPWFWAGLLVTIAVTGSSGCSHYSSVGSVLVPCHESKVAAHLAFRAHREAHAAWRACYAHQFNHDTKQGFVDGFVAVASGAGGCPPMFAPSASCCGLGPAPDPDSWFRGYTLGTVEAEKRGADRWNPSRINPALMGCLSQPGCSPGCIPCEPILPPDNYVPGGYGLETTEHDAVGMNSEVSDSVVEGTVSSTQPLSVVQPHEAKPQPTAVQTTPPADSTADMQRAPQSTLPVTPALFGRGMLESEDVNASLQPVQPQLSLVANRQVISGPTSLQATGQTVRWVDAPQIESSGAVKPVASAVSIPTSELMPAAAAENTPPKASLETVRSQQTGPQGVVQFASGFELSGTGSK